MIRTALILALLATPAAASAQLPMLRARGTSADSARAVLVQGVRAYPTRLLAAIGADVQDDGARVVMFGDTLRFSALSPYFTANQRVYKLVRPARRADRELLVTGEFFSTWLPAHYPRRVAYADGRVTRVDGAARGAAAVAEPPVAEPPRTASARAETPVAETPRVAADAGTPGAADSARAGAADTAIARAAKRVVVLDAGHGGRDPGKIGPNGVREKDVTLAVTRRLAALLQARGYEVHLTRDADTLIALADRPALANRWKNGRATTLFLSLHANSGVRSARGFETYFLSDARTEDERRVMAMENEVVKFEIGGEAGPADALGHILSGLRNDFYMQASNDLAETVQRRLAAFHPGPDRGVKRAGFRVLVGALMPAVLVEMAFVSNPQEAQMLATSAFQQKIAWGLLEAVDRFFDAHAHLLTTEQVQ